MTYLVLNFWSEGGKTQLASTEFHCGWADSTCFSVRGKVAGAYAGAGTFQWSRAVHGLCLLMAIGASRRFSILQRPTVMLTGGVNTLASSLSYAIDKQPGWIVDMFGANSQGVPNIKRLILRSNAGLKSGPEVALSVNSNTILPRNITLKVNGALCECESEINQLISNLNCSNDKAEDQRSEEVIVSRLNESLSA